MGLRCEVPALQPSIDHFAQPFLVDELPDGFVPVEGHIHRYVPEEVNRHLSPTAVVYPVEGNRMEIYCEDERFWLVDDRWGLAELNLVKGSFHAWILDRPTTDSYRVFESAVLWPMAQLTRVRGLSLVPGVSVARADWGMLLINPFGIEQELSALIHAGFKVIGQRWTALREEDGRVSMLHVPGLVERGGPPRVRSGATATDGADWLDLTRDHPGVTQNHAFCDSVVLIEPGRRPIAWTRPVGEGNAFAALRRAWPILELHPQRRHGRIIPQLAAQTRVSEMRLSRNAEDILARLDSLRYGDEEPIPPEVPTSVTTALAPPPRAAASPATPQVAAASAPEPAHEPALGTAERPIRTTVRQVGVISPSDPAPPRNLTPWSLAG